MSPIVTAMTAAFGASTSSAKDATPPPIEKFTSDAAGLAALDAHLATRATVSGYALDANDATVYITVVAALKASTEALTHARRWAAFVSARGATAASGAETFDLATTPVPVFERPAPKENKGGDKEKASTSGKKEKKDKKEKKEGGDKGPTPPKEVRKDVSVLDIRVGVIEKAWEHPGAEKLWCENINLGEKGVRQICSGLRAFKTKEQMEGARVCVIVNVKPGKLRDVTSDGLVLCTSNADHTEVDFVIPPEGAAVGERVMFAGFEGEPEAVLNPKKKQLDAVSPDLKTNAEGVACYKDVPFMTTAGPCTSPLKECLIK